MKDQPDINKLKLDVLQYKEKEILKYCQENIEYMWAVTIVSILLNCDFRDAPKALKEKLYV